MKHDVATRPGYAMKIMYRSASAFLILILFCATAAVVEPAGDHVILADDSPEIRSAKRILAAQEKALGPEHRDVAKSLNDLGLLYHAKSDYSKAEPIWERALKIREVALGPEHADTATSLNNLAEFYRLRKDYARAEPLHERALRIREKVLGAEHLDTATSLNNLAVLYHAKGDDAMAENLCRRALNIREKVLGSKHADTLQSWNNLAVLSRTKEEPAKQATKRSEAPARMTIAVLAFEDKTGNPEAAHWGHSIQGMLEAQFREVRSIRVLPREAAEFGLRNINVKPGQALTSTQATKIGELIEARRVIWGSYERRGEKWRLNVRVLNVAIGEVSAELQADSNDWFEVRDAMGGQILKAVDVVPAEEELAKMARRGTKSPAALEALSKAYALHVGRKPFPEVEEYARKALTADSQYGAAYTFLASSLASQGKFASAEEAARQAIKIGFDNAGAHQVLGIISIFQEKIVEAEKELREASRFYPDDPETFVRLGELYAGQDKLDEAIRFWIDAAQLHPTSANIHAHLGRVYAMKGDRAKALAELKEAERLDPDDPSAEQMICQAYDKLHETPAAIEHYEKFIAWAQKLGAQPEVINNFQERVQELKTTLTPHYLTNAIPKAYTAQTLDVALRERLTDIEFRLVANPLRSTPEMKRWAQQLTQGAKDDFARAKQLFEGLARRIDPGVGGSRTAQEVFAAWDDSKVSFRCQEYARLFVALARELGINAFFVMVDKDVSEKVRPHACAGVFVGGKALLVDPSYRWFGVPHKKFEFLDDLQATAHYLSQLDGDVPRKRIAVKFLPESPLANFNLAFGLMESGQMKEASVALEASLGLERDTWLAHYGQGAMASFQSQWMQAESWLQSSLALNPDWDKSYFFLAQALQQQGKFKEAREQYRAYLRHQISPELTAQARHAIAQINEKIGGE